MSKATAVWLVDNTSLTFAQIARFCNMHELEIEGIANGDVAEGILGMNPVEFGQLSMDNIRECEADNTKDLVLSTEIETAINEEVNKKGARYTPIARRADKPSATLWLLRHCPQMSDKQIMKLIGTTKATINAVKSGTHWDSENIREKDPVLLGLCLQSELDAAYAIAKERDDKASADTATVTAD